MNPSILSIGFGAKPSPMQRAILERAMGSYNFSTGEVRTTLESVTDAIESAFVLVPREALPKIAYAQNESNVRKFYFDGNPWAPYTTDGDFTSERARSNASKWLAIAGLLEAEEKDKAAEAKRKADADKAALEAEALRDRLNRLEELATEWFDEPYDYLGAKKKAAVEEIYRLERELDTDASCDECAA